MGHATVKEHSSEQPWPGSRKVHLDNSIMRGYTDTISEMDNYTTLCKRETFHDHEDGLQYLVGLVLEPNPKQGYLKNAMLTYAKAQYIQMLASPSKYLQNFEIFYRHVVSITNY